MTELFKKYVFICHLFWSIFLQKDTEIDNFLLQDEDNTNLESLSRLHSERYYLIKYRSLLLLKKITDIYKRKMLAYQKSMRLG